MVMPCYVDSNGMRKGAWSEEEDKKLRERIQFHGHPNWRLLPEYAGLARSGKSCRLRWVNYLKPGVKRGNYNKEEVHLIMKLHGKLGNRRSAIAKYLPGRTDNGIKNYWHGHVYKRYKIDATGTGKNKQQPSETSSLSEILKEEQPNEISPPIMVQNESAPKDIVVAESSYLQDSEDSLSVLNNANCVPHDTISWDTIEEHLCTEPSQINYFESSLELNYVELFSPNPSIFSPHHYLSGDSTSPSDAVAKIQDDIGIETYLDGGLFSPYFLHFDDKSVLAVDI